MFRDGSCEWAPVRVDVLGWDVFPDSFNPRIEVEETDTDIRISAELPGIDEKSLEVNLADEVLTIRGEKRAEREERSQHSYRSERIYGAFQRAIPLPVAVDEERIEASFKKGVLAITLPKSPETKRQAKAIQVKSE